YVSFMFFCFFFFQAEDGIRDRNVTGVQTCALPIFYYQAFGGYEGAEQQRILIYPPYYEPTAEDFEITLFEINYPTKFSELSHGQVMGSVLGTGISRGNLGDILTDGQRWQFFVDARMKDFILMNVDHVGRINVHL